MYRLLSQGHRNHTGSDAAIAKALQELEREAASSHQLYFSDEVLAAKVQEAEDAAAADSLSGVANGSTHLEPWADLIA